MTQREFFDAMAKLIGLYLFALSWITLFGGVVTSLEGGLGMQLFGDYLRSAIPYMAVGLILMGTSDWITKCCFREKKTDEFHEVGE